VSPPAGRSRARFLAAALACAGALLSLGLWLAGARPPSPAGPTPTVAAAPPSAPPAPAPPPGRKRLDLAALPGPVRRFLESTPYPASSGRLTRSHEDLLRPNRRHERPRPIPDTVGHDPARVVTWLFSADHWSYTGPAVVHAWLEVRQGGRPLDVEIESASAVREGRGGAEGPRVALDFRREGERFETDLPLHLFADHHGAILLELRFEYAPGKLHHDALRIFYTPADRIPAELTGGTRDFVRDESLVVAVDVDVARAGFYRFDANLYGPDGEPVAFAAWKGELDPGLQSVDFEVYGKVLRDAGIPGPYTVEQIRGYLFLDGQYPDYAYLSDLPAGHETAPYSLDPFTDEVFVDAHRAQLAEMLAADLAAGIFAGEPPAARGSPSPGDRPPDDDAEVPGLEGTTAAPPAGPGTPPPGR
jgi:hypothetical protein